jgi:hypothetical protein
LAVLRAVTGRHDSLNAVPVKQRVLKPVLVLKVDIRKIESLSVAHKSLRPTEVARAGLSSRD